MKRWIIQPHHKKSIEEVEIFKKDVLEISHRTGWRWGSWIVSTNDNNPPKLEFEAITGGDSHKDSIDMNDCLYNNIENVELIETSDGCWEDTEFPDEMDEVEVERLQGLMDDEGIYILEENEGWTAWETEMWITGPIEILNEDKELVQIITADEDGQAIDYKAN